MRVKFKDIPEAPPLSPEDDYILCVVEMDTGFTPKGDEKVQIKCRIEQTGGAVYETFVLTENAQWKLDSFLRATAMATEVGQDVELDQHNLLGQRAWAHVVIEEYDSKVVGSGKKKRNKVSRWLNKERLPRNQSLIPSVHVPVDVPADAPTSAVSDDLPF